MLCRQSFPLCDVISLSRLKLNCCYFSTLYEKYLTQYVVTHLRFEKTNL